MNLPESVKNRITRIDFHKGRAKNNNFKASLLGGLTLYFSDGTNRKIGPQTQSEFRSVDFSER